jgi:hypothetical protein
MNGLADAVLVVHAALVVFIVGGLVAVWVGAAFNWRWVRGRGFRGVHLAAICVVALLALLGVACPLTVLEDALRHDAGATQGFVQRWVGRLLYYELPAWVFTVAYAGFAALVALTWRLVPPARNAMCKVPAADAFSQCKAFQEVIMKSEGSNGNLRAFVQTAERAGGFVWVITLVDFDARNVRRALVSDDSFSTAAAAKDAGEARLAGIAEDR